MTIEEIRRAYNAQPFVPFVLHLADGRGIRVPSREFVGGALGRTVVVHRPDGRMHVIDLLLVTDLEFEGGTAGGGPQS